MGALRQPQAGSAAKGTAARVRRADPAATALPGASRYSFSLSLTVFPLRLPAAFFLIRLQEQCQQERQSGLWLMGFFNLSVA
jgi:hypothetical protein